jgi:enamine deaminase RidA (YjgF/YER057c/UK114 family)
VQSKIPWLPTYLGHREPASTYWYLSADVTSRRGRRRPTRELFSAARPVATTVVGAGLLDPRWKVEIKAEAVVGG